MSCTKEWIPFSNSLSRLCDDPSNPIFFEILDYSVNDLSSNSVVNVHFFSSSEKIVTFNVLIPTGHKTADVLYQKIKTNPKVILSNSNCLR